MRLNRALEVINSARLPDTLTDALMHLLTVVRSQSVRERICQEVVAWIESVARPDGSSWRSLGVTESPITGPNGNVEFILCAVLR